MNFPTFGVWKRRLYFKVVHLTHQFSVVILPSLQEMDASGDVYTSANMMLAQMRPICNSGTTCTTIFFHCLSNPSFSHFKSPGIKKFDFLKIFYIHKFHALIKKHILKTLPSLTVQRDINIVTHIEQFPNTTNWHSSNSHFITLILNCKINCLNVHGEPPSRVSNFNLKRIWFINMTNI